MSDFGFLHFLWEQMFFTPPYPEKSRAGQTIIVTGANTGLGLEAAKHFTRLGAEKVIVAVRNLEKGEAAKKTIEESTQRLDVVEVWSVDLSSHESIKQFAKKVEGLKRLDAIVENAGVAATTFYTVEGNEANIAINVVSTYLMALLVLPKLRESASRFNVTPYLSIINSNVHGFTQFPERNSADLFERLNEKETANTPDRYPVSKLINIFYGRELAARSKKSSEPLVIINFSNPGLGESELSRDGPISVRIMKFLFARTTEVGSRALVYSTEAGQESHGQYLSNCQITPAAPLVRSDEGAKQQARLWEEVSKKLEAIQPGILTNV